MTFGTITSINGTKMTVGDIAANIETGLRLIEGHNAPTFNTFESIANFCAGLVMSDFNALKERSPQPSEETT